MRKLRTSVFVSFALFQRKRSGDRALNKSDSSTQERFYGGSHMPTFSDGQDGIGSYYNDLTVWQNLCINE